MSTSGGQLDTLRTFETPEGVSLGIRVAGPLVRSLAFSIDVLVRMAIYTILAIVLGGLAETGQGLLLIGMFLTEWFYPVFFELRRAGQTPGKKALGIAVVHDNGTPVGFAASLVRNLLRFADFVPMGYAAGLTTMVFHEDFKRLGDLAAGTVVVYRDPPLGAPAVPEVEARPLPEPLGVDEQRALLDYARRRPGWTQERAEELADILAPLTRETGRAGELRLLSHASWLLGRR